MTSQDITEVVAYYNEEPFGAVREDLRMGMLLAMFHGVNKSKESESKLWYDFLPNADMPADKREALEARVRAAMKDAREKEAVKDAEAQAENAIAVFKSFNARWAPKGK